MHKQSTGYINITPYTIRGGVKNMNIYQNRLTCYKTMAKLNRLKSNHHGNHVEKHYFKIELIKVSDEFEFIYKRKSAGKIISLSSILHAVIIVR